MFFFFQEDNNSFVCTCCNYVCPCNATMEMHLESALHREAVSMMNNSVPVVVRVQTQLTCADCTSTFRFNLQLRRHVAATGHRGAATSTDDYQRIISCPSCPQIMRSTIALQRHQLSNHSRDVISAYFCSTCRVNFATSREAILHRRTAAHKDNVAARRRNVKSTNRTCQHCNVEFDSLKGYKAHLTEQHPELCYR